MNEIARSFSNSEGFAVTPIMMNGQVIFLCQEIEKHLGYVDLSHSVCNSPGLKEGVDYLVLKGDQLRNLKDLINKDIDRSSSNTAQPVEVLNRIRFAPSLIVLTESGFYALSFRSDKAECVRFRTWVTSEVLPKIRQTGSYQVEIPKIPVLPTTEQVAISVMDAWLKAGEMLGVPRHIAQIEAVKYTEVKTGVDYSPLLTASPTMDKIKEDEIYLEPSEIGKRLGIEGGIQSRGRVINNFLAMLGWQIKVGNTWQATQKSKSEKLCFEHSWKVGAKSGYNLKWKTEQVIAQWKKMNALQK